MLDHLPPAPALMRLPLLEPTQLSHLTKLAAQELLQEGESANTLASYRSALRYWSAWYAARYGQTLRLPVPAPVVVQFIVDHVERTSRSGLVTQLPAAVDQALVTGGFKGKLGAPTLSTLAHRISVLSKTHQVAKQPNPCADALVRELLAKTRRAYAKRGAERPHKQRALTKEPFQAVLDTCDESLRGQRDRALLLFAWSTGGRRRSEVAQACVENLRRVQDGQYIYSMGHSKTNQSGVARPEDNKPLVGKAAQAMQSWLAASQIHSGALFRRIRKGDQVGEPLSASAVRKIVKERCVLAGMEGEFSAHSLRSGFVTEAGRRNMSLPDTMALTGHRSVTTVLGYFRAEGSLSSPLARLMEDE
ncbi:site-specific integrase [Variovorax sp. J22R24]|uniref:site-specific integrase n=1 Tax=Variovorax gracilis TaxID=3053502 RepID=UPI002578A27E|nr:site-specific integrase [Variovorax sp. J22R24]MDM0109904.1 site-specific integrase [Variovorax sp. J22R24]